MWCGYLDTAHKHITASYAPFSDQTLGGLQCIPFLCLSTIDNYGYVQVRGPGPLQSQIPTPPPPFCLKSFTHRFTSRGNTSGLGAQFLPSIFFSLARQDWRRVLLIIVVRTLLTTVYRHRQPFIGKMGNCYTRASNVCLFFVMCTSYAIGVSTDTSSCFNLLYHLLMTT